MMHHRVLCLLSLSDALIGICFSFFFSMILYNLTLGSEFSLSLPISSNNNTAEKNMPSETTTQY